jgi:hypothetical protein
MKYCIYKGTGGLIHMLCGLVHCILWSIKNNHILIIDVKSHKCYNHYLSDFFELRNTDRLKHNENYSIIESNIKFNRLSMDFIKNYDNIEVDRGLGNNTHIYLLNGIKLRINLDNCPKEDKVKIYAGPGCNNYPGLIKFIKVKNDIINKIKEEFNSLNNYIGVHFRNTDIKNDISIIIKEIKNYPEYNNIYLATDDYSAYDKLKLELPNYNIYQYTKPFNSNGKPIHYSDNDKYRLVFNTLVDIYFLNNSNVFIPSLSSSISRLINHMRLSNNNIFI